MRAKKEKIEQLANAFGLKVVADVTPLLEIDYQRRDPISELPRRFFGDNYDRIGKICGSAAQSLGYDNFSRESPATSLAPKDASRMRKRERNLVAPL